MPPITGDRSALAAPSDCCAEILVGRASGSRPPRQHGRSRGRAAVHVPPALTPRASQDVAHPWRIRAICPAQAIQAGVASWTARRRTSQIPFFFYQCCFT